MKFFRSLLLIALAFSFSQNLLASPEKKDIFYAIQKSGEIKVGVSILAPWVMKDKKGELIGFEIDVTKQLAKDILHELDDIEPVDAHDSSTNGLINYYKKRRPQKDSQQNLQG